MGVAQDFAEAMRWYRLARRARGWQNAQEILGLIYSKGGAVCRRNYTEAIANGTV